MLGIEKHPHKDGNTIDGRELMERCDDDPVIERGVDTSIEGYILRMTKGEIITPNVKPVFDLTADSSQTEIENCIEGMLENMPVDRVEAAAMIANYKASIDASKPVIEKLQNQRKIMIDKIENSKKKPEEKTTSNEGGETTE